MDLSEALILILSIPKSTHGWESLTELVSIESSGASSYLVESFALFPH